MALALLMWLWRALIERIRPRALLDQWTDSADELLLGRAFPASEDP